MPLYAIIIDVPEPQDDCFIVAPFAEEFESVRGAVRDAVNQLGMRPRWVKTGEMQASSDFVQDIVTETRAAKIVVAVCSPEGTGTPNPNVMYEVGLAHALGKPTVLLTTDPEKLPPNIKTKHALPYDPNKVRSKDSINQIRLAISERLQALSEANPLKLHFLTILSFVKSIYEEVHTLNTVALDNLQNTMDDMVFNPDDFAKLRPFLDSWRYYENWFQYRTQSLIFDSLANSLNKVDYAFQSLFPASLAASPVSKTLRETYDVIKARLNSYPSLHETAKSDIDKMPLGTLPSPETLTNLSVRIRNLSDTMKPIGIHAVRLNVTLIEMILKAGD